MKSIMTRSLLSVLLITCCVGVARADATEPVSEAMKPAHRNETEWWAKRMEEKNARMKEGNVDLLFIGDSITHSWEGDEGKAIWDEYYGDRNAANIGFSGDRTQHVLWRFAHGNIDGISPKVAVIMIGTNNAGDNSADEIADGIRSVVATLRQKLPNTKLLLLGVFPRDVQPGTPNRNKLKAVNEEIATLDDGKKVFFLDIGQAFLTPEGVLTADVMPDSLHPNAKGYKIWAEAMEPKLSELLGDAETPTETPTETP